MHLAVGAVWTHRFRSLLTILGIVIGITTVVTVASLLTGLRQGVVTFFQQLGPDNIFLFKSSGDPNMDPPPKERKRRSRDDKASPKAQIGGDSKGDVCAEHEQPAMGEIGHAAEPENENEPHRR